MKSLIRLSDMQRALLDARSRTNDPALSHCVKAGRFQLNRVVYRPNGRSDVTPLSPWNDAETHLALIRSLTT